MNPHTITIIALTLIVLLQLAILKKRPQPTPKHLAEIHRQTVKAIEKRHHAAIENINAAPYLTVEQHTKITHKTEKDTILKILEAHTKTTKAWETQ